MTKIILFCIMVTTEISSSSCSWNIREAKKAADFFLQTIEVAIDDLDNIKNGQYLYAGEVSPHFEAASQILFNTQTNFLKLYGNFAVECQNEIAEKQHVKKGMYLSRYGLST